VFRIGLTFAQPNKNGRDEQEAEKYACNLDGAGGDNVAERFEPIAAARFYWHRDGETARVVGMTELHQ
jgi:hypothetical protein